ncbi:MAG: AAA-like domain-containing protein [Elainella sp.]
MLLSLPELTPAQIEELAERYELPEAGIGFDQLQPLLESVGGHPYLLHLAFALRSGQAGQQS